MSNIFFCDHCTEKKKRSEKEAYISKIQDVKSDRFLGLIVRLEEIKHLFQSTNNNSNKTKLI